MGALLVATLAQAQLATTPPAAPADQNKHTNAVAAVVNGEIITLSQLLKQVDPRVPAIYDELAAKYPNDPDAAQKEFHQRIQDLETETLHGMAEKALIIQEFKGKGYSVPQVYLQQQFDDSITTRFQGDHAKYLAFLEANKLSEGDYRKQLENDDIVSYQMGQLRGSATGISPDRIKAYYEKNQQKFTVKGEVKVRQITLTPVADETVEVLRQQAEKIVQQARQPGANFTDLALQSSTDLSARHGSVPVVAYELNDNSKLAPPIQDVVFKLQPGEVSDPVVSGTSVFIFKCEDKVAEGAQPLEKVRAQIEATLADEDSRQAYEKWISKLRDKAYILYNLDGS
jgi:parvulin-like peptidyl-prolyl isomerase